MSDNQPNIGGWSPIRIIGLIVIFAAAVAILYVGLAYFGIHVPQIFVTIFFIVLVAAACLLGLYFLTWLWKRLP